MFSPSSSATHNRADAQEIALTTKELWSETCQDADAGLLEARILPDESTPAQKCCDGHVMPANWYDVVPASRQPLSPPPGLLEANTSPPESTAMHSRAEGHETPDSAP
jgi:hypothetical protein